MLKRSLAAALGLLALCSSALAQQPGINSVPQTGVLQASLRVKTYGAVSVGLVPAAAATDIFCIGASASKTVAITRVELSGTATTALSTPVVILRRASLDTGGTAATGGRTPFPALARLDPQAEWAGIYPSRAQGWGARQVACRTFPS